MSIDNEDEYHRRNFLANCVRHAEEWADEHPKKVDEFKHVTLETKLDAAKAIAGDFRPNTSLGTIIREYESRVKEIEKEE